MFTTAYTRCFLVQVSVWTVYMTLNMAVASYLLHVSYPLPNVHWSQYLVVSPAAVNPMFIKRELQQKQSDQEQVYKN